MRLQMPRNGASVIPAIGPSNTLPEASSARMSVVGLLMHR